MNTIPKAKFDFTCNHPYMRLHELTKTIACYHFVHSLPFWDIAIFSGYSPKEVQTKCQDYLYWHRKFLNELPQ